MNVRFSGFIVRCEATQLLGTRYDWYARRRDMFEVEWHGDHNRRQFHMLRKQTHNRLPWATTPARFTEIIVRHTSHLRSVHTGRSTSEPLRASSLCSSVLISRSPTLLLCLVITKQRHTPHSNPISSYNVKVQRCLRSPGCLPSPTAQHTNRAPHHPTPPIRIQTRTPHTE